MSISAVELRGAIEQVRRILEGLEKKLDSAGGRVEAADPYTRRREILQRIYWSESMEKADLMTVLGELGTNYAWIGQQVKKGYLAVAQTPRGTRYSVTQKAVRDERLADEDSEVDAISMLSMESFAKDWDSKEDAAYDSL